MNNRGKKQPRVRTGQGEVKLSREEFARRFRQRFYDPAFERVEAEIARIKESWSARIARSAIRGRSRKDCLHVESQRLGAG